MATRQAMPRATLSVRSTSREQLPCTRRAVRQAGDVSARGVGPAGHGGVGAPGPPAALVPRTPPR